MSLAFNPPPVHGIELPRQRLLRRMTELFRAPVCALVAATGYGKTFAARELWYGYKGSKAWLTVEPGGEASFVESLQSASDRAWGIASSDLADELGLASNGLLVIDMGGSDRHAYIWSAVVASAERIPPGFHLLLLCRELPVGLAARWRSQGHFRYLGHDALALDQDEWVQAGFAGEERRQASLGWWSAALAIGHHIEADPVVVTDWVANVWWPTLDAERQDFIGQLALAPNQSVEQFCLIFDRDGTAAIELAHELAASSGVVRRQGASLSVAPFYRHAIVQAWRRTRPQAWTASVQRALDYHLAHKALEQAAALAEETGFGVARALRAGGWSLLYGSGRGYLGRLLALVAHEADPELALLRQAWRIESDKASHLADKELHALLPRLAGEDRASALSLLAHVALDYDDCAKAEELGREALAGFLDDKAPAYIRARLTRGCALNVLGRLDEAEAEYRAALACAGRDRLPWLQLEGMQRRAHLAHTRGLTDEALRWLNDALRLANEQGLNHTSTVDSCRRLLAWMHLDGLRIEQAEQTMPDAPFWSFPRSVFQAALALARDDMQSARALLSDVEREKELRFLPLKWRNEAAFVESWFAARSGDQGHLLALDRALTPDAEGAGIESIKTRIVLAGLRVLAGRDDDRNACEALLSDLREKGLTVLARQLALVLALRCSNLAMFTECLRDSAANRSFVNFLWLGPICAGPLERALEERDWVKDPAAYEFGRTLLQRLLAPVPIAGADISPPLGLTPKEAQILRLIGQHYSNEQIAAGLFISIATVKTHINHLYGKLQIKSRSEAIQYARRLFV